MRFRAIDKRGIQRLQPGTPDLMTRASFDFDDPNVPVIWKLMIQDLAVALLAEMLGESMNMELDTDERRAVAAIDYVLKQVRDRAIEKWNAAEFVNEEGEED